MDEEKKEVIEVKKVENNDNIKQETKKETPKQEKKGFCIASLVLGIVTLVFFCIWYISIPCGILAIIFGILGVKTVDKGMAIAGLITGSIGLAISTLILIFIFIFGFAMGMSGILDETDYDDFRTHNFSYDYDYDDYDL